MMLDPDKTIGIMKLGGTILGTTNKGHFVAKVGEGNVSQVPVEIVVKAKNTLRHLEIGALIVVGGDGSLTTGLQLYQMGIPVIGVPKTIDNDIQATAMTFGFDSAVAAVVDALDRLHTTAESHKRAIVLEVMGRHAGWIALYGGMAGGADIILLPEIPFKLGQVAQAVRKRDAAGRHSTLVVVAEGARLETGELLTKERVGGKGEDRLGGIGDFVAKHIEKATGKGIKNEASNGLKNDIGTVAMARTNDPNSATAQFFINVAANNNLNAPSFDGHGYAVFGKVVEGMEVVNAIKAVPTGNRPLTMIVPTTGQKITQPSPDVPNDNVVIQSITVLGDKK
jgi:6-phosphofructokinase